MKSSLIKIIAFLIILIIAAAMVIFGMSTKDSSSMQNSFFSQFIIAGGPVVWLLLLPMSFLTIYLATDLTVSIKAKKIAPAGLVAEISALIKKYPNQQWLIIVNKNTDFISNAVLKIMNQTHLSRAEIDRMLYENIEAQALKVLRKIEWANIIGNVAPMIGLFGTVFGMIKAFNGIVIAGGQPQPAHLAEGISLALVTTFWGLLVAIPALAIAGIFRNRLETLTANALADSEALVPLLKDSLKNEKDYIRKLASNRRDLLAGNLADSEQDSKLPIES